MSHIDDGRLNALLDGELGAAEADEVRKHIATCADCAKRLDEATRFLTGAADLLGALDLPAAARALPPANPAYRVPKTAREVAIDLDGATRQSPAIRPNIVTPPPPAPPPLPTHGRFDLTTLSWAAMVVLALGVGYLANEVRHARFGSTSRAAGGEKTSGAVPAVSPAAPAARPAGGEPGTGRTLRGAGAAGRAPQTVQLTRPAAGATHLAGKSAPQPGKRLSTANAPQRQQPRPAAPANQLAAAAGAGARARDTAAVRRVAEPAPTAPAAERAAAARSEAPLNVTGVAAAQDAAATFRRATLEEAVARLNGAVRLMDGMRFEQVEIGPGSLVTGADPSRDLVRLVYVDAAGQRLVLDQQRVTPAANGGPIPPDFGMRPGDTLTSVAPGGEIRVRWFDGTFWLSLSGHLPPEELRSLLDRVR